MSPSATLVDCIYVACSAADARFTRICVASIRHFYPDVPVRLLRGGHVGQRLESELRARWNVEVAGVEEGDFGWGFVKLEPLFGKQEERFLVIDADTILTGNVLDIRDNPDASFVVDDEQASESKIAMLYFDWKKVQSVDPDASAPAFVFNSGQWFGTSGVLKREDFSQFVEWSMPRVLRHPQCFMPGDQGVLNYVLNKKAKSGEIVVDRKPLMRWPAHGLGGLSPGELESRTAPPFIIHWAGLKKFRLSSMPGSELLKFFERKYFEDVPLGMVRMHLSAAAFTMSRIRDRLVLSTRLRARRLTRAKTLAPVTGRPA